MRKSTMEEYVNGAFKITRMQSNRERYSRGGLQRNGRRVRDICPEDDVCDREPGADLEFQESVERASDLFEGFVCEETIREDYRDLLRSVFLTNDPKGEIADRLGIVRGTARSKASRFAQRIGLRSIVQSRS